MNIVTENEKLGHLEEGLPHTAWVIRNRETGSLHTIAADRKTTEYIVGKKIGLSGGTTDDYMVEVWHIMQSPDDYDEDKDWV